MNDTKFNDLLYCKYRQRRLGPQNGLSKCTSVGLVSTLKEPFMRKRNTVAGNQYNQLTKQRLGYQERDKQTMRNGVPQTENIQTTHTGIHSHKGTAHIHVSFIHTRTHTHAHSYTSLTICFSVYLLELSRLTASMCPKSMSCPSRKMKSSLQTYFFLL